MFAFLFAKLPTPLQELLERCNEHRRWLWRRGFEHWARLSLSWAKSNPSVNCA